MKDDKKKNQSDMDTQDQSYGESDMGGEKGGQSTREEDLDEDMTDLDSTEE